MPDLRAAVWHRLGDTSLPAWRHRDAFAIIVGSAVLVHLIFRKWEPMRLSVVSLLLFFVPSCLSVLLIPHLGTVSGIAASFLTYYTALFTSIILYRISPLHPLHQYPGPLPAKITKWWHTWQVYQGKQHLYLQAMHDRYGDVVRIGPNEVSMRDVSCITPVLGAQGMPKSAMFFGRNLWPSPPPLIAFRDPAAHLKRRKPWNRAFSTTSVKEFEPIIQHRVQQFVDALAERQGQVLDLAAWVSYFTYDFMGDMVFGGWTEMMRDGVDKDGLWNIIQRGLVIMAIYGEIPWLSYYTRFIPPATRDVKRVRQMAFSRTEKRYATGSTTRDLFYYLSNEDGSEKVSPPRHVVISDGLLALIAGSDTTATVVTNTLCCLLHNPNAYKQLQAEVDKFYPPGENSLDPKHLKDMYYLEAVINEGLRLFPAVPSGSQRAPQVGQGGKAVGPYYIPEGTQTRIHFWSVHRDARNFSHPETFWPERWLIAEGLRPSEEKINHNANAFIPFSFGPYNCVGKNVAMQEMRILLCHLMQRLNLRFPDGFDSAKYYQSMHDMFVMHIGELPIIVEPRE